MTTTTPTAPLAALLLPLISWPLAGRPAPAVEPLVPAPAQEPQAEAEPRSLLEVVPPGAIGFVSVRDIAGLRADFRDNAWGRMLRDPGMQELRDWALELAASELGPEAAEDFRAHAALGLEALQGEAVLFAFARPGAPEGFGLLFDPGAGRASFEELLAEVADGDEDELEHEDYQGVALELSLHEEQAGESEPEGGPELEHRAFFEHEGVWCLLGTPERDWTLSTAHGVIDRLQGAGEAGLESNPLLAAARASGFTGRIEGFLDIPAAVRASRSDELDEMGQRVIDLLGVEGITWVYATADLGAGEDLDVHLRAPMPSEGYIADWLDALLPVPVRLAGLGPADAVQAGLYGVDVFALWESAWDFFSELEPEGYEQGREAFEAGLQSVGGLDPEGDLLAQLSGEFAIFSLPVSEEEFNAGNQLSAALGTDLPEALQLGEVHAAGLEDAETVELFLEEVLNVIGALGVSASSVTSEDYQGHSIQALELPMGMTYSWAFTDDLWVGSLYPSALRSVLALVGKPEAPSIARSERFAPHLERHAQASVLVLYPSDATARMALAGLQMLVDMGSSGMFDSEDPWDNDELGEPVSWAFAEMPVPDASLPKKYLRGTLIGLTRYARDERLLRFSLMAR